MNKIAIRIGFKASGGGSQGLDLLEEKLQDSYIIQTRPNGGPQSGGLLDSIVEVFINITLEDFFRLVRDGIAWDLLTRGKNSFILRPIIEAFRELERTNLSWDYLFVKFVFDDTEVKIYGLSKLFMSKVGLVVPAIAKHYQKLIDPVFGAPYQILVPISKVEDENGDYFMNYGGGDDFEAKAYLEYWGIVYALGFEAKIFDVKNEILIDRVWKNHSK